MTDDRALREKSLFIVCGSNGFYVAVQALRTCVRVFVHVCLYMCLEAA